MAGIINTLAGNGSAITLSILIFMGFPADVSNATNRIGALAQTITAVFSLKRTPRTKMLFNDSYWFFIPSIIGSIVGAIIAVEIDPGLLKMIIGGIMLLLLITLVTNPKKWNIATDVSKNRKTWINAILVFLVAIYGGFLQMGIGIMLLSILVLIAKYSLRDANIIKLVLAVTFVMPAFFVFLYTGGMEWIPGITLAVGQSIGAVIGARYILFLPKANLYVRWLLIVILTVSSIVLLRIPEWMMGLFDL
ncbi:putative permease [Owenweeksia hongkongensis DSM 17368]|uniref:Probable membrane transporter protein n=2 Tax=Owenweeksia TaxID=267986 RepID=G8R5B0_OWEHD|nr:putative permease [Owenweeksia hongkongensis DSM 17368]